MEPMKAPWADPALTGHSASDPASSSGLPASSRRGVHTGNPVKPLIDAEPALPSVNPRSWPSEWEPAAKRIRSQHDVQSALQGSTLRNFVSFTLSLSEAVTGVTQSQECNVSPAAQAVLAALDRLLVLCEETPATTHEVRYGNPAYREWFDKMQAVAPELVYDILGDEIGSATVELVPYVLDSFGNRSRIDYGTGHETTFLMFLYCLFKLGVLRKEDQQAVVVRVFKRYLDVMRTLQTTYWLEPAGSHGVWGLDEYHFFPFVFGASQLVGHPSIKPESICNDAVLKEHADEYLYMDAVKFVRKVKKGPLHETSPMLYDISGVASWPKVNKGLFKMYQVEVLSKFPIMQHALWGALLPFPGEVKNAAAE